MKLIYTKPMLTVDLFSLGVTNTRDCGGSVPIDQLTYGDIVTCVWDTGSKTVFVEKPNCDIPGENMGYGCYNNPSEGNYIFRS